MKNNKKAFTIVELVVVIAVIAILAGVLVPTFSNLIKKAQTSKDEQLVRNMNTALSLELEAPSTMQGALDIAASAGYDVEKINASNTDNEILWDSKHNLFCYYDGVSDKKIYVPGFEPESNDESEEYEFWAIVDKLPDAFKWSLYASSKFVCSDGTVEVEDVGFDAGHLNNIKNVKYTGTKEHNVVIRTNSYDTVLTINAPADTVKHYDKASKIDVEAVAMHSYYEFGDVLGNINLTAGNVVVEEGCKAAAVVIDMTAAELATVTTLSADNSKAPEVPIILNTSETLWGVNPHNDLIDPEKNNIIYANLGGGTLPENFNILSETEKEQAIATASSEDKMIQGVAAIGKNVYDSVKDAIIASKKGDEIVLLKDKAELSGALGLSGSYIFNLNGNELVFNNCYLSIQKGGSVTMKNGTLSSKSTSKNYDRFFSVMGNYDYSTWATKKYNSTLNLEQNLTINADNNNYLAVVVFVAGNGATVNVSSKISCGKNISAIMGNGTVSSSQNINYGGTTINVLEGAKLISTQSMTIYHPQNGKLNVEGGYIEGLTCIYIKSGILNVTGGSFHANGDKLPFNHNNSGAAPTGDAIVIESCSYPGGDPITQIVKEADISSVNGSKVACFVYYKSTDTKIPYISIDCEEYSYFKVVELPDSKEGDINVKTWKIYDEDDNLIQTDVQKEDTFYTNSAWNDGKGTSGQKNVSLEALFTGGTSSSIATGEGMKLRCDVVLSGNIVSPKSISKGDNMYLYLCGHTITGGTITFEKNITIYSDTDNLESLFAGGSVAKTDNGDGTFTYVYTK